MKTEDQITTLFALLNKAFDAGKIGNLTLARSAVGDYRVAFEWVTQWKTLQPFELHVDFVLDACHSCLGFEPDDARIGPYDTTTNTLEEWRRIVAMMDDRLASVERFLTQVREELLKTQD